MIKDYNKKYDTFNTQIAEALDNIGTEAVAALKDKPEIQALVVPSADYSDMTEATAAIKAIIEALKA